MCTEICFAGACFRSKLPRVYWLGYLPGRVFRERVSGASSFVCTGWSTYPGARFGSVFQEQAPSCVPAYGGQFTLSTQLIKPNYLSNLNTSQKFCNFEANHQFCSRCRRSRFFFFSKQLYTKNLLKPLMLVLILLVSLHFN